MKTTRKSITLLIMVLVTFMVMPFVSLAADSTPATVNVSPSSGSSVSANAAITVYASDSSGIYDISYLWDSGSYKTIQYKTSTATLSLNAPSSSGSHTLKLYVRDNSTSYNTAGWVSYTYTVGGSSGGGSDYTNPTVTVSPSAGNNISAGSNVTVYATDANGIYDISYLWDSGSYQTQQYKTSSATLSLNAPSSSGSHTLKLYVRDNSTSYNTAGWVSYTYTIGSNDNTNPTVTVSPSAGNSISAGSNVTVYATDSSGIYDISYRWNNESYKTTQYKTSSATQTITAPSTNGTNILQLYVRDNSTSYNTAGWVSYTYTIGSNDSTNPTVTVSPSAGNSISAGSNVTVYATDSSGIYDISYRWNNESYKTTQYKTSSATLTVTAPSTNGTNTLQLYVRDNSSNYNTAGWVPYTYTIGSNDNTPPTVTVSPVSGSSIAAGSTVTINATDASGIYDISYRWNNESYKTTQYKTSSATLTVTAPSTNGTNTLQLYVRDNSSNYNTEGWKSYIYIIGSGSGDTTPPTVTVSPVSGSTISAGSTVTINATDASGIYDISYRWNNESYKTVLYKTSSATLTVTAPSTNGTNILQLYVRDNSSNYNTAGWVPYTYTIGSGSGDTTPPTVTLSPSAGSTISAGSSVTIYATDASGIYDISYRWDNQTYKTVLYKTSTATLTVTAPSTNGTHGLQLYVRDNSSNYNTEGWKTYYYTIGSSSDDYTAPVICVSPIQGDINAGANVTIEATDDSGIYSLSYYWDNNSSKTVYTDSTITTVPSTVGTHYLYASAKDNSSNKNDTGWRTYIYNVVDGNGDVTPPTTKHSPDTRRIQKGKKITLTATDASGIQYMCYKWDDGTTYTVYSDEIVLYAPNKTGTRDLYVMAVDNSSNHNNSGWSSHTYRIVDDEDEDDDDDEDPTITVTPPSGSSIQPSSTLKIYAYDDSDIDSISYYWDNNSSKTVDDDTVTVTAPSTNGVHILYAKAIDDSSNSNSTGWKAFTYTVGNFDDIIYPGGPTDGTINPGLKALKLEIRNAMDRVKYSVNEEIQYYIDYYNASGSEQNNLQVVFNIPDGFEVTDYNKGTKVSNTVVWSIGKLASLQSGRLYVKVKCTTANTFERIVLVTAEMRQGGTLIDTSMLRNLIFTSNIKGYHQKYIIGYPGVVFKPERGVTRAEFAAMLVRIFNVSTGTSVGVNPYHDIHSNKSHWAYDAIVACTREGLFTGYPDGTFRPESVVTRAEFTTVLARKLNLGGVKTIWIHANDLKNHWAMNEMEQLIRLKIIQGYTDGSAKPDRQISRSEAVTLLNRYNFRGSLNTSTSSFKDVSINHWAHKEIEEAARNHAYYRDVIGNETVSN